METNEKIDEILLQGNQELKLIIEIMSSIIKLGALNSDIEDDIRSLSAIISCISSKVREKNRELWVKKYGEEIINTYIKKEARA